MKKKKSTLAFIFLLITCLAFVNVSEGIEVNPTKKQVDEAVRTGKEASKNIFTTSFVKPATFGKWPSFGGGLVKSKLVQIAVVSAMKVRARKKMTEEDTQSLLETNSLVISYRGGADIYKIKLRQGTNVIEPTKMVKPDMAGKDPSEHKLFTTARFPYSRLELNAKTTIVVEKDFGNTTFEVNFANIP